MPKTKKEMQFERHKVIFQTFCGLAAAVPVITVTIFSYLKKFNLLVFVLCSLIFAFFVIKARESNEKMKELSGEKRGDFYFGVG